MKYKRKKTRRSVRCTLCTPHRWKGNHKERRNYCDTKRAQAAEDTRRG